MPLQKDSITFNFNNGVDTFTDPNQLPIGKFQYLQNCVFVQAGGQGKLQKRNGYVNLSSLDSQSSYIASYSNGLIVISDQALKSYSPTLNQWQTSAFIRPMQISVNTAINNSFSQFGYDMCFSDGLACIAYLEYNNRVSSTSGLDAIYSQQFTVIDTNTNQPVIPPTLINSTIGSVSTTSIPRVFSIGSQFAIFSGIPFAQVPFGLSGGIQFFTINKNSLAISSASIFTTSYFGLTVGTVSAYNSFDGVVASNSLYFAWYAGSASGKSGIMATSFSNGMVQGAIASITQSNGAVSCLSLAADNVGPSPSRLWATYVGVLGSGVSAYTVGTAVTDFNLNLISSVTLLKNAPVTPGGIGTAFQQIVTCATNGTMTFFLNSLNSSETQPEFKFHSYQARNTGLNFVDYPGGTTSLLSNNTTNLNVASKPVVIGSDSYILLSLCDSLYQSTYFLYQTSTSAIVSKFSYGNGGGNPLVDLPQVNQIGSSLFVGYLNKNTITNPNKSTNVSSQIQVAGIYTQTGVNYIRFNFTSMNLASIDSARNLHITGGQFYHYDGLQLDELNFNIYPDRVIASGSLGGGLAISQITPQTYFYVATYEYTDNKGNIFRSSPSIPVQTTVASGQALVLVSATPNNVTLKKQKSIDTVFYRWSQSQQIYYKIISIAGGSSLSFFDYYSDAQILGNEVLYTNGGVLENSGAPACNALTMFDSRMWLVDAENPNLLWFSQPIIDDVPVDFSQLLTYFVPPTTSTGAPSGPVMALAPMDDKLILFKNQTIYYISGSGPDSTGNNNNYTPTPIFVAGGVGCSNQNSIVLIPQGLLFQAGSKGIWLLKRDLSIEYIGKDIISYESAKVLSACLIPNTNHVKLTLDSGITLLYDYLVGQWGVDTLNGKSATIYNGLHTFLSNTGSIYQENAGSYLDGTVPVVMQWQTGFLNPTGLQGYQRAYRAYVLGEYLSGQTYTMGIAYDFNPAIVQTSTVTPANTLGSGSSVEQWQINFQYTQCQSFQLTFNEISSGTAGAGLSLSGVDVVVGRKKSFPRNLGPKNRIG